jgi:DNA-binding XRE family transcriptional regulator
VEIVKNFNFRKFRKKYDLTQNQMALELEVHVGTYILWEKGISKPNDENKLKLINFLKRYNEGIK